MTKGGPTDNFLLGPHNTPKDYFNLPLTPEFWKEGMRDTMTFCKVAEEATSTPAFSAEEIDGYLGLLFANGLHPWPQVDFAFASQSEDWLLENDPIFVASQVGQRG